MLKVQEEEEEERERSYERKINFTLDMNISCISDCKFKRHVHKKQPGAQMNTEIGCSIRYFYIYLVNINV